MERRGRLPGVRLEGRLLHGERQLLRAPGYGLVNVNIHYDTAIAHPYLKGAIYFFEVKNLLDKTYVASANNITDSINAATGLQNPGTVLANTGTGSIYAGAPRQIE